MRATVCCYCHNSFHPDELRPYGPDGTACCHPCGTATPERQALTTQAMGALFDAAEAVSPAGVAAITDHGYEPFDPSMLDGPTDEDETL